MTPLLKVCWFPNKLVGHATLLDPNARQLRYRR